MKKTVAILTALSLITISGCKKTEAESPKNAAHKIEKQITQSSRGLATEDSYVQEAKSHPLTTVAISGPDYDFGKIKKGSTVEHTYEFTNTGDKPLIITAVKPGCGCTAPEYTKTPVLPRQKAKVTLKFDSSNFDGSVHKFANVFANVEKAPINLTFTANIQP